MFHRTFADPGIAAEYIHILSQPIVLEGFQQLIQRERYLIAASITGADDPSSAKGRQHLDSLFAELATLGKFEAFINHVAHENKAKG